MTTSTDKPDLTLYGIETQLMELLNFRDSVIEDPDMTPTDQKASLEAVDAQILFYISAEVKKCDGIAKYLREFKKREEAEDAEIDRLTKRKQMWKKRRENLENTVINIMQQMGKTRIDGVHSVLNLRNNPKSVEVQSPDLVPGEYERVTITMTAALWAKIRSALALQPLGAEILEIKDSPREPMKQKIGEELKAGGSVPGCRLVQGVRLEVK